jgi:CRISPR system Cascade subunit CasE
MYFSRVTVAYRQHPFSQGGIYSEHQLLWKLFPDEPDANRDFLFRKIESETLPVYYLLSQREPVASDSMFTIESKPFGPQLNSGDRLQFSLRANATVTKKVDGKESKKRKRDDVFMEALAKNRVLPEPERKRSQEVLEESGRSWLMSRSEKAGFALDGGSLFVEGYQKLDGLKKETGHSIKIGAIDFSGILTVTDPERFKETLLTGIGKSRAFGCGLLLIRRV